MNDRKQYYFYIFFLVLQITLLQTTGCKKEYSYEGGDLTVRIDSMLPPPPVKDFPVCSSCRVTDDLSLAKWNFKTGNAFLCGVVNEAGIDFEKTAFTFFGPSACSIDTGLVMTIYLPIILDKDRFNITTTKVAFFYYDHHATKDIFISQPTTLFSVTLQSFIYATGIATGTFNGTVFKPNGDTAFINEGKFEVKLR
jgi:hypothetical protein